MRRLPFVLLAAAFACIAATSGNAPHCDHSDPVHACSDGSYLWVRSGDEVSITPIAPPDGRPLAIPRCVELGSCSRERVIDFFLDEPCGTDRVMGLVRIEELRFDATGTWTETVELATTMGCVAIPWRSDDVATPLPPVTERLAGAIVERALPRPVLGLDPDGQGLVNLETRYWFANLDQLDTVDHDGDPSTPPRRQVSVDEVEGPYRLSGTAWVERWWFDTGADRGGSRQPGCSPAPTVLRSAGRPGSAEDPAATFTYRASGDYRLCAGVTWRFEYAWQLLDGSGRAGAGALPALTVWSPPRAWQVHEARSYVTD